MLDKFHSQFCHLTLDFCVLITMDSNRRSRVEEGGVVVEGGGGGGGRFFTLYSENNNNKLSFIN